MTKLVDCTDTLKLKYDRDKKLGYGVPVDKDIRFMGDGELYDTLYTVRADLNKIGWWEHIDHFLTAGLHVDKKGAHGDGLAWDFDGVVLKKNPLESEKVLRRFEIAQKVLVYKPGEIRAFNNSNLEIYSLPDHIRTRFDCLMNLRFPVVLTQGYPGHADHGHYALDPDREVKWRGSKSQIILLQETLNAWESSNLVIDGIYGDNTEAVWQEAMMEYFHPIDPLSHLDLNTAWKHWLKMIAFDPPGGVA